MFSLLSEGLSPSSSSPSVKGMLSHAAMSCCAATRTERRRTEVFDSRFSEFCKLSEWDCRYVPAHLLLALSVEAELTEIFGVKNSQPPFHSHRGHLCRISHPLLFLHINVPRTPCTHLRDNCYNLCTLTDCDINYIYMIVIHVSVCYQVSMLFKSEYKIICIFAKR